MQFVRRKNTSKSENLNYSPSRINAHSMFPLFPENRNVIQLFLVIKTLKKCKPPDFKIYPKKLTNKHFPHMV